MSEVRDKLQADLEQDKSADRHTKRKARADRLATKRQRIQDEGGVECERLDALLAERRVRATAMCRRWRLGLSSKRIAKVGASCAKTGAASASAVVLDAPMEIFDGRRWIEIKDDSFLDEADADMFSSDESDGSEM